MLVISGWLSGIGCPPSRGPHTYDCLQGPRWECASEMLVHLEAPSDCSHRIVFRHRRASFSLSISSLSNYPPTFILMQGAAPCGHLQAKNKQHTYTPCRRIWCDRARHESLYLPGNDNRKVNKCIEIARNKITHPTFKIISTGV